MDNAQKRCFVVMGFGIKTDLATGRKLDLNKSYRLLIKPVIEGKGLICIRADEIHHSGVIDVPMYMELMMADVVIADLSTANTNAFYELGVRHALRPRTTIVISEDKMPYPFDVNHINITSYTHLGDAIDFDEVERFRKVLGDQLDAVLNIETPDSPVYTYLDLVPPSLQEQIRNAEENIEKKNATPVKNRPTQTLSKLAEEAEAALCENDFSKAKKLFKEAVQFGKSKDENNKVVMDAYLMQRLALATYKAEEPDTVTALNEGLKILFELDLAHTNDPETVALAGAIEKRLYEHQQGEEHLSAAIQYYQRGYFLLNNRYNGINLAFMLDYRAQSSLCTDNDERIADLVNAKRIRREVLAMCDKDWKLFTERQERANEGGKEKTAFTASQLAADKQQIFWVLINRAEAHFGLGNMEGFKKALAEAEQLEHEEWMMDSLKEQIQKLEKMKKGQEKIVL
ncbi:MAG: tetratricopeptide repeat-containing protein [Ferruginibacter sp.]